MISSILIETVRKLYYFIMEIGGGGNHLQPVSAPLDERLSKGNPDLDRKLELQRMKQDDDLLKDSKIEDKGFSSRIKLTA